MPATGLGTGRCPWVCSQHDIIKNQAEWVGTGSQGPLDPCPSEASQDRAGGWVLLLTHQELLLGSHFGPASRLGIGHCRQGSLLVWVWALPSVHMGLAGHPPAYLGLCPDPEAR